MLDEMYFQTRFKYDIRKNYVWKKIVNYLQMKFIHNSNLKILDVGAGYCYFINNIQGKFKFALDKFDLIKNFCSNDVKIIVDDAINLRRYFKKQSIDIIFASNFFEHLDTMEKVFKIMKIMKEILAKNGKLIILQPNFKYCYKEYFDDYTHKQIFTHISLKDILENIGFTVEKVIPKFLPFSMKTKISIFYKLIGLYLKFPIKFFGGQMLIVATKE